MIDRVHRDQYAALLRHLFAGVITNKVYEDRAERILDKVGKPGKRDNAIRSIYMAAWTTYSDIGTHKMTGGHALEPLGREEVAKWILFLYSDQEYVWPENRMSCMNVLTLGLYDLAIWPRRINKQTAKGEIGRWPFANSLMLADAKKDPRLLNRR